MNYSKAIFLISDDVRGVLCTYEAHEGASKKLYKTFDPTIEVDDFVVIPTETRHGMTVVKVTDVDVEPDLDNGAHVDWIIGRVDRADFEALAKQEAEAIERIKAGKRREEKAKLRETMLGSLSEEEVKALPNFTAQDDNEKAE